MTEGDAVAAGAPAREAGPAAGPAEAKGARALIWALTLVLMINMLDRQMMTVLGNVVARDLGLSDTEIGLLGGIVFSTVYALFSLPWGMAADHPRSQRVWVIASALAIWSAATAACAFAQKFFQMLLGRMGVAAGEAGCVSPSKSLIADVVPPARLAWAMSIFGLGIPIGSLIGRPMSGFLADQFGWRSAFLLAGVPGILVAVWLAYAFRQIGYHRADAVAARRGAGLRRAFAEIARSPALLLIALGDMVMSALALGMTFWGMIHLQRNLGLSTFETGLALGLLGGATGLVGNVLGGWISDRFAVRSPRYYLVPAAASMALAAPFMALVWQVDAWWLAILLLALPFMADNIGFGGIAAATQRLLRPEVRASSTSMLGIITLLGSGFGVTIIGVLSDFVRENVLVPGSAGDSLRHTLSGAALFYLVGAAIYWLASRHVARELEPKL